MKTLLSIAFIILLGTALPIARNAAAATKKKTPDKVPAPATTETKPPITTNETWTPKTNRQPVPTDTPVKSDTPAPKKNAGPNRTPVPTKPLVLGDKLKTKIVSNPQPKLPDAARNAKVSGPVRVEVTLDEKGNVLSAKPLSGNTMLQQAAVDSARKAKFKPTLLSGTPVKVTGVITYNFVLQ
ncbi:MAG TPA: TonB family protein [Chthoniobacterales bacterium]|nr:TonB family protein [Chthoniobacterales bacterium]